MEVSFYQSSDAFLTKISNNQENDKHLCTRSLANRVSQNCLDGIFQQILYAIFYLKKPVILPTLDGNITLKAQNNHTFYFQYFEDFCHNQYQK